MTKQKKDLQKRRNITLSDQLAKKAQKIGSGNISRGIRKALEQFNVTLFL